MSNELNINDIVELADGSEHKIVGINKGWIELESGRKIRAKQVVKTVGAAEPEAEEEDEDLPVGKRMSKTLAKYRPGYSPTVSYSGNKSANNGDGVAELLEGLEPEVIMAKAEQLLGLDKGFLSEKYANLNPGQRRMNSGNRIRAAIKRGDLDPEAVAKAFH